MPEHLRALVVILALAALVFACAKKPVCYAASQAADFARRRNVWFLVTLAAFFAHNFWLFIVCAASVLFVAARREWNPPALFFLVLFAVPQIRQDVPGLGPMRYFFTMDYVRLLAVVVLLPAFLRLRHQPDVQPVGRPMAD